MIEKTKVLLLDNGSNGSSFNFDDNIEIIKISSVSSSVAAKVAIEKYPEARWILLDGRFSKGDCGNVVAWLDKDVVTKIICFAINPEEWRAKLSCYGVRHFPGKEGDYLACIKGVCQC